MEIISEHFTTLIKKYNNKENVLLLLDPPYIFTKMESYQKEYCFDLIDFLNLINLVKPPFIFFGSTKSEFPRYIDSMIENKWQNYQAFINYRKIEKSVSINFNSSYDDNIIYKF